MTLLPKPFVDLTIAGNPAGPYLEKDLKTFTYSDVHHGAVDEIGFTVADPAGKWRSDWGIDEGTEISAVIGYRGLTGSSIPCGHYAVDEPEISGDGSGDTATFRALAAFTSKDLRTVRSAAYDQLSLVKIIDQVAARHTLTVTGEIPDLSFERITQNKESDLAFLTRLAGDWGCYFSIKGDQLVFTTRESIEKADPVRVFDLPMRNTLTRYTIRRSSHDLYARAEARYFHSQTKQTLKAIVEDERVPSGDTLKIDERAETQGHAERMCVARLAYANDGLGSGQMNMVGDPLMVAGQVIELGASFGRYVGRWLVTAATHSYSTSGYTTSIKIKEI